MIINKSRLNYKIKKLKEILSLINDNKKSDSVNYLRFELKRLEKILHDNK